MNKWSIDKSALRNDANGTKLIDVPSGSLIDTTGKQKNMQVSGKNIIWSEITFKGKKGWVNDAYLEEYTQKFPIFEVPIANPTPDTDDAAQYIFVLGGVKHNLCGEFCVAFILGKDIDSLLKDWKEKTPEHYNKIIGGSKDLTTGAGDLELILKLHDVSRQAGQIMDFKAGLTDPVAGYLPSIGRMKKKLDTHQLIAGLNIDGATGKLRGQGVGHWVVLDKVTPVGKNNGNGGWVEIYNPFPNRREEYSYDEFTRSCGSPENWNGLWVQRTAVS